MAIAFVLVGGVLGFAACLISVMLWDVTFWEGLAVYCGSGFIGALIAAFYATIQHACSKGPYPLGTPQV